MEVFLNFLADIFGDVTHAFIVGFIGGFGFGSYSAWRIFQARIPTTFKNFECVLHFKDGYTKRQAQIGFKNDKPIIAICENCRKKTCELTGQKCQAFTRF